MKLSGFIEVRQDTPLLESVSKAKGQVVERHGLTKIASRTIGTKHNFSSIKLDGLVEVRQYATLLEFAPEAISEFAERRGSARMARGTLLQGHSELLHVVCHVIAPQKIKV
jgi:hypothetical protein